MTQFIRGAPDPRDAAYGALSDALGMGLGKGINTHFANRALDSVLKDKSLQSAPLSEKMKAMQSAITPFGENGINLLKRRLEIEQQGAEEKQLKEEKSVLGRLLAGEKLDEKEYASLSPKTQISVLKHKLEEDKSKNKINAETLASGAFSKGYKAILDKDLESFKEVISDPNTPLNVKSQLSTIQNQFAQRSDVSGRDVNRRIDSVQNAYRKAISAERNRLGKYGGFRPEEVKSINDKISKLESSRDKDMSLLLKNPENYSKLSIWGNPEISNFLPNDVGAEEEEEELNNQEEQKPIYNPVNPEHRALAEKLFQLHGDKEKVREILSQTFKFE